MNSIVPNKPDLSPGQVVAVDDYYSYDAADDAFVEHPFNVYEFDYKISVISASGGDAYFAYVSIGGDDELLFTGTVDSNFVIPKAMALECGRGFQNEVVDLSAGPMKFGRYLQVGAADDAGAYLLTMKGSAFAEYLAQMDTYASIAMVDIASGLAELKNDIAIRADYVEVAGGAILVDGILDYSGDLSIVSGRMKIARDGAVIVTGILNDLGMVGGHGTLDIAGGYMSVANGALVDVKTWLSKGTAAHVSDDYIEDNLVFTRNFIVGAHTDFTFYKSASLTVNEIRNFNGRGGLFTMNSWDPQFNGDETIDVLGHVWRGEEFNIGTTDVLELGDPVQFRGVIDDLAMGTHATAAAKAIASGGVALDGIWNFVSVASNGQNETVVTMQDIANGLLAHIDFAGAWDASEFSFYQQIKGVTPTSVIARTIT